MRRPGDEDDRLGGLLRAMSVPEPPADFLAGAHRRYREALDARSRRDLLTRLAAGLVGLGLLAWLLAPTVDPAGLVAWLAEATADAARWTTGAVVVLSLIPVMFWVLATLGFVASTLALILLARPRSLAVAK